MLQWDLWGFGEILVPMPWILACYLDFLYLQQTHLLYLKSIIQYILGRHTKMRQQIYLDLLTENGEVWSNHTRVTQHPRGRYSGPTIQTIQPARVRVFFAHGGKADLRVSHLGQRNQAKALRHQCSSLSARRAATSRTTSSGNDQSFVGCRGGSG